MDAIGYIILQIFVLLLIAKVLGQAFEIMKMPSLIGQILAGVIFINLIILYPEIGDALHFYPDEFMHDETNFIHVMGEIGIIFLLFIVGLETRLGDLIKVGRTAMYVAILGIVIPLVGGAALMLVYDPGNVNLALLVGTAMFAMSTGVTIGVLRDLNAMSSKEAKIIIGAAVIDDILCLSLLAIISGIVNENTSNTTIILNAITVVIFLIITFVGIFKIRGVADRRRARMTNKCLCEVNPDGTVNEALDAKDVHKKSRSELSFLGIAVLVCFGMSALSYTIGLAGIIGAFLAGMIFAEFKDTVPCEENFNVVTAFMLPFFFIYVGLMIRLDEFDMGMVSLLVAMIVVAILTKFLGGYIGSAMDKMPRKSSVLIGVSMIPRGEVGIIVASIGLSLGIFTDSMFTVVIMMTLATSIIAPPLITWTYRNMHKENKNANIDP